MYGGGFQSGASHIYRPTYFMDEDVVFVSINYRLGAMGFLSNYKIMYYILLNNLNINFSLQKIVGMQLYVGIRE